MIVKTDCGTDGDGSFYSTICVPTLIKGKIFFDFINSDFKVMFKIISDTLNIQIRNALMCNK